MTSKIRSVGPIGEESPAEPTGGNIRSVEIQPALNGVTIFTKKPRREPGLLFFQCLENFR